jgi:glycosyltransferase involved in cell wall biosynthesis
MSLPKVIVIMPAYNASRFIRESISSILNQRGVDVNLMVIDDASTDDTYSIAKSIRGIKIIRNTKNMGNYYSANLGLNTMLKSGFNPDYYLFHGADDVSNQSRFIKQISKFKDGILAVGCRYERVDFITRRKYPTNPVTNESMLIFKKEVADIIGYRENGRAGCDTEYKKRLLIARPGSISSIDEVLLTAYLHDSNLTKKIPIGGSYRKNYVASFTARHKILEKTRNFYIPFETNN